MHCGASEGDKICAQQKNKLILIAGFAIKMNFPCPNYSNNFVKSSNPLNLA